MMADPAIKIGLHETVTVVRQVLPVGVTVVDIHTSGNSVLSSAYVKSGAGAALVKWYDHHSSNGEEVASRFDLAAHPSLTIGQKSRLLVPKIHSNAKVEITVTGAPAEVMVIATLVEDFPVEVAGPNLDGSTANLLLDGGLPTAIYDPSDGKFYLLRGSGGVLATGSALATPVMELATIASANVEQSHTFPAGTRRFMMKARGPSKIKLSHTSGGAYMTIWPGAFYCSPEFAAAAKTIYFQSPTAGLEIEMESWS
jgi:hypothetical protein